jgi:hypothetical protein
MTNQYEPKKREVNQLKCFGKGFLDINRIPTIARMGKNDSESDDYLDRNTGSYEIDYVMGTLMGAVCEAVSAFVGLSGLLAFTVSHDRSPVTMGAMAMGIPAAACIIGNLASLGYEAVRGKYLEAKGKLETKCEGEK